MRILPSLRKPVGLLGFAARTLWDASPLWTVCLFGTSLLSGLMPVLQIVATRELINTLAHSERILSRFPNMKHGAGNSSQLLPWIIALIASQVLVKVVDAISPLLTAHLREHVGETLERRVYRKALSLSLETFDVLDYYDKLERARRACGPRMVRGLTTTRDLLAGIVSGAGILWVLAHIHWLLALVMLVTSIFFAAINARMSREFVEINYRQSPQKRRMAYWRGLSTKREAAAELRLFGLAHFLRERWKMADKALRDELFVARRHFALRQVGADWCRHLITGIVMASVVLICLQGAIRIGLVVATLYALQQLLEIQIMVGGHLDDMADFVGTIEHLQQFLTLDVPTTFTEAMEASGDRASVRLEHCISFEQVSFTYPGAEGPALGPISLEIRAGEHLALVGENGAGKSTLVRLLLGLFRPTAGRILIDGVDLTSIDPAQWYAETAAVFQNFMRYNFTVQENIGLGDTSRMTDIEHVRVAARQSGAHEFVERLPQHYETLLGKGYNGACDLSVGQWQQLALARAYLRDARILVLDEPAASLDALAEQEVYQHFSEAAADRTMVLISHRLGSARLADRIIFLEKGQVREVGSHEELAAAGGRYAEMYALQAAWYREPEVEQ